VRSIGRLVAGAKALLALTLLCLSGCGEQRPMHDWVMSLPWSEQEFHTHNARRFARAVEQRSGGRIRIRVYAGGVLGLKGPEALRALSEGVVHLAEMPGVQQIGTAPILALDSLPFLARDQAELRQLDRLARPAMAAALQEKGAVLLYRVPWPNQYLYFKRPTDSLAAMQGLRIRTYDRLTSELMRRLGLNPVQLPLGDVVPALASGVVDATMTSATSAAAQRYWDFMSHLVRSNHTWLVNLMAVEAKAWARLDADLQQIVRQVADEMEAGFWAVAAADDAAKRQDLRAKGMQVIVPDPAMLANMEAAARPMWQAYVREAGPEAQRILQAFLDARR